MKENLESAVEKLHLFNEALLNQALKEFISKGAKHALTEATNKKLRKEQKSLIAEMQQNYNSDGDSSSSST